MRVLLVDDQVLMLEGLRTFLEINGYQVVGKAQNGAEALLKAEMLKPELVLMDIQMKGYDGIETTQMMKKEFPEIKIVMLTAAEDDDSLLRAIQVGAEGYLLKDMEPESFLRQLNLVASGEMPLAPGLAKRLLRNMQDRKRSGAAAGSCEQRELTKRQTELLQLMTQGMTYKEISEQLGLTVATIRYHIQEMLAKTKLANRTQLIARASQLGVNKQHT